VERGGNGAEFLKVEVEQSITKLKRSCLSKKLKWSEVEVEQSF